jgi:hypothetical protein
MKYITPFHVQKQYFFKYDHAKCMSAHPTWNNIGCHCHMYNNPPFWVPLMYLFARIKLFTLAGMVCQHGGKQSEIKKMNPHCHINQQSLKHLFL